jgi:hypothetical protein
MFDRFAIAIAVQLRIPVLVWGPPGVGKSMSTWQMAEYYGRPMYTLMASSREPSDFAGLPYIDLENKTVFMVPPEWAKNLPENAILLIEEASTINPSVQAPLMRVIHEKTVGDNFKLPDSVSIIALANPADQAAGGWELAPPLANRFFHVDWQFEPSAWTKSFIQGFPAPKFPVIPDNWTDFLPQAKSDIAIFINKLPSRCLDVPKDDAKASRAWPSPRSWDMAATLRAAALSIKADEELTTLLLSGCVGPAAAGEFMTYIRELDLPDPEKLLANPESIKLPDRPDRAYAVLTSVISAIAGNRTPARWIAGCKLIAAAGKTHKDMAALALFQLTPMRPSVDGKPVQPPAELSYMLEVLVAARVNPKRK